MKKPRKIKQYIDQNPIEQFLNIGGGVAKAGADLGKDMASMDRLDDLLGITKSKKEHQGDLLEGQELTLKDLHEETSASKQEKPHIEAGIDYTRDVIHIGERMVSRENQEFEAQMKELMIEIKKLADTSKDLQNEFREVAVEQYTVTPGKYHKTFFSWLLNVVQQARMKVEDSGAWLAAMQSKKKNRQYWSQFKKSGTSFALSNERSVATQVG